MSELYGDPSLTMFEGVGDQFRQHQPKWRNVGDGPCCLIGVERDGASPGLGTQHRAKICHQGLEVRTDCYHPWNNGATGNCFIRCAVETLVHRGEGPPPLRCLFEPAASARSSFRASLQRQHSLDKLQAVLDPM